MPRSYTVSPLTPEEQRWVRALERLLLKAPARLELYTVGDRGLTVFTNEFGTDGEDDIVDCRTSQDGRTLASVRSACKIHGLCG